MATSKKVVGAAAIAAAAVGVRAMSRRRRRAHRDVLAEPVGEGHAPGHEHLHLTPEEQSEPGPAPLRSRPWRRQQHGLRHPGRC